MRHLLKRHPFAIAAHFRHCLVLAYALPAAVLEPLLPEGLSLDVFEGYGFVAVALVQTERLRPASLPAALGRSFFLAGYRVFARYKTREGRNLRGLRILRSDTDSPVMATFGNLFTHYGYRRVLADVRAADDTLEVRIRFRGQTDLHVVADLCPAAAQLPPGSPFRNLREARRFAGPMPFTFDYEMETHSILRVQGVRPNWDPRPVSVTVPVNRFFDSAPFWGTEPVLASAFHVANIDYRWEPGIREPLPAAKAR